MYKCLSVVSQAHFDLQAMVRHVELINKALESELEKLHAIMDEETKDLDEYDLDGYFREINDYWIETAEELPLMQWYAQFMVAYSRFEKALNDICKSLQSERSLRLNLRDIYGRGIYRAKTYLTKVALLQNAFNCPEWKDVETFALVRNIIAHRNGYVEYDPENKKSDYNKILKINNVEFDEDCLFDEWHSDTNSSKIIFRSDYVLSALKNFHVILEKIFIDLKGQNENEIDDARGRDR